MKLYQIFHRYCKDRNRKGILYNVVTRKDVLIMRMSLFVYRASDLVLFNSNSGISNPQGFLQRAKSSRTFYFCFSIFIFWKNLRTMGLRTSIKLSDEFHKSLKKSKQTQMTGPTTTFIIF